jgi:hypothetical protein
MRAAAGNVIQGTSTCLSSLLASQSSSTFTPLSRSSQLPSTISTMVMWMAVNFAPTSSRSWSRFGPYCCALASPACPQPGR